MILVSPGGGVAQIQTLVKRMPDVAEVSVAFYRMTIRTSHIQRCHFGTDFVAS